MLSRVGKMLPSLSGGGLYGAGYPAGQVLGGETSGFAIDFTSPGGNLLMRSGTIPGNYVGFPFVQSGGPVAFSRASLATVTDADGKIKWAPHNLLLASEQFDASNWTKGANVTLTANASSAPNGTTTADRYSTSSGIDTSANGISQAAITGSGTFTIGVWMRSASSQTVQLRLLDFASQVGNLNCSVTSAWTLFTVSGVVSTGTNTFFVIRPDGTNAISNLEIWGAHLYRSDLGGMVANTSAYPMYNPTTPKNLLGYTESFDNAAWQTLTAGVTVSANSATSPIGLQTADTLTLTSTAYRYQRVTLGTVTNRTFTFSVWLWSLSGKGTIVLRMSGEPTGTDQAKSVITLTSTPTRYSVTRTFTSTDTQVNCGIDNRASQGGDGLAGSIVMWGAQLSDSASLDPYVANNFAAPSAAAFNGPRLDYDPSTLAAKGLLVEEQRTNFFTNSNVPSAGTGVSVTANASTSPDGTTTAYRIAKTDATTPRYISRSTSMTAGSNSAYTVSAWYKYDGYDTNVSLEYNSSNNWGVDWIAIFSVASTGVSVSSTLNCSAAVQNYGNGWYKVIVTFTSGASPSSPSNPLVLSRITGASGVSVLGYGAQLEAGSFATSYIPTTSATVTRSADVAQVSTQAFPYSQTEGTMVVNFDVSSLNFINWIATLHSGSISGTNDYISLVKNTTNIGRATIVASGVSQGNMDAGTITLTNTAQKLATAYAISNSATSFNGGSVVPLSPSALPSPTQMTLGSLFNQYLNGHIRQITYIPRRLSNAELQARTA